MSAGKHGEYAKLRRSELNAPCQRKQTALLIWIVLRALLHLTRKPPTTVLLQCSVYFVVLDLSNQHIELCNGDTWSDSVQHAMRHFPPGDRLWTRMAVMVCCHTKHEESDGHSAVLPNAKNAYSFLSNVICSCDRVYRLLMKSTPYFHRIALEQNIVLLPSPTVAVWLRFPER